MYLMICRILIQKCVHIYLALIFLVLRAMILYLSMIPLSSLSSLIDMTHQHFACMLCMILLMILSFGCRVVFGGATVQGLTVAVVSSQCQKVESWGQSLAEN
jgi:hypothetical protein